MILKNYFLSTVASVICNSLSLYGLMFDSKDILSNCLQNLDSLTAHFRDAILILLEVLLLANEKTI